VELPGVASAAALDVALEDRVLTVRSTAPAPLPAPDGAAVLATYALSVRLPYPVVGEEAVRVKFNPAKAKLSVILKVAQPPPQSQQQQQQQQQQAAPLVEVLSSSSAAAAEEEAEGGEGAAAAAPPPPPPQRPAVAPAAAHSTWVKSRVEPTGAPPPAPPPALVAAPAPPAPAAAPAPAPAPAPKGPPPAAAAGLSACGACGARGVGLSLGADGRCGHCTRTQKAAAAAAVAPPPPPQQQPPPEAAPAPWLSAPAPAPAPAAAASGAAGAPPAPPFRWKQSADTVSLIIDVADVAADTFSLAWKGPADLHISFLDAAYSTFELRLALAGAVDAASPLTRAAVGDVNVAVVLAKAEKVAWPALERRAPAAGAAGGGKPAPAAPTPAPTAAPAPAPPAPAPAAAAAQPQLPAAAAAGGAQKPAALPAALLFALD